MELFERAPMCSDLAEKTHYVMMKERLQQSLHTLALWREVKVERRRLLKFSDDPRFLKDIGVSLADAMQEADKPFWKQ